MPTEEEVQEYLSGLNRTEQIWTSTLQSERAKEKGITNYKKWFKDNKIKVRQKRNGTWEIVEATEK